MEIHALRIQNNLQEHEICSLKRMCKFYKDNCELFKNEGFDTQFRYNSYGLTQDYPDYTIDTQKTCPNYTTDTHKHTMINDKPSIVRI